VPPPPLYTNDWLDPVNATTEEWNNDGGIGAVIAVLDEVTGGEERYAMEVVDGISTASEFELDLGALFSTSIWTGTKVETEGFCTNEE
jgi:hypothetical protein